MDSLTFANMYQLGYIVRDVEKAMQRFREVFGIERFRVLRHSPDLATAHAWVGDVMVELIETGPTGPSYFQSYIPEDPEQAVFHHNAYRVHTEDEWNRLKAAAQALGFTYEVTTVRDGDMNVMFVDLRHISGTYAEYVYLKGAALSYYDDVPRN